MNATWIRKGGYILPNLFTTGSLYAGFYAILQGVHGRYDYAAIAIFIAIVLDGLDGRVARWAHAESRFGAEYDSLADMVSFGVAPAILVYQWALADMGRMGWVTAFIYALGAGLRLARFNAQPASDKRYFLGLPSPSAAALIAGFVWVLQRSGGSVVEFNLPVLLVTMAAGLLMVSNIRYRSFKEISLRASVFLGISILAIAILFVIIEMDPLQGIYIFVVAYALSGPCIAGVRVARRVFTGGATEP